MKIIKESIKRFGNGSTGVEAGDIKGTVRLYVFSPGATALQKKMIIDINIDSKDWIEVGQETDYVKADKWKDKQDDLAKEWEKVCQYVDKERNRLIEKYSK